MLKLLLFIYCNALQCRSTIISVKVTVTSVSAVSISMVANVCSCKLVSIPPNLLLIWFKWDYIFSRPLLLGFEIHS